MNSTKNHTNSINRKKLFAGICLSLIPTAFSFVLVSNILNQLKTEFILTNAQVGFIGGAALWGMSVSLLILGPFLEKFGLKTATKGALICQLVGVTLFLAAAPFAGSPSAYWILFLGAIGFGAGNGLIEVAGNPLTAALFPTNKTTKLNHFHAFFYGGMVVGGLLGWGMVQIDTIGGMVNIGHWTWQIAIIYIPIIIYGVMLMPEKFPKTETEAAGLPIREMFRYTLTSPLVWGLILLFMVTLPLVMGPNRWIPEVLQASGLHGMLVFVWMSGIMCILRLSAGSFVKTLSPPGMIFAGCLLTGTGLLMFYYFETGVFPLMIAATVFACGGAFFVPTFLGLMSERFPKAGSLGIVLLMGLGNFAAGGAQAIMGDVADYYMPDELDKKETVAILGEVENRFPEYITVAQEAENKPNVQIAELGYRAVDLQNVLNHAERALTYYKDNGKFSGEAVGNALRALINTRFENEEALIGRAFQVLRPADNYGGRMAFFWLVPIACSVAVIFLVIYINDKRKGGYKAVRLEKNRVTEDP